MTEREISKMIYTKFPVTKKEQEGCIQEKLQNLAWRAKYEKEIRKELKEKKEYDPK